MAAMAFPTSEILFPLVQPVADQYGMDSEYIKMSRAGKESVVAIAVDADNRPDSDVLEAITQEISELFDEQETAGVLNFGPGYTLEVSTPGVSTPLTKPRHWRRNRGRLVTLVDDGKKRQVRIGALNDDETSVITIERVGKKFVVAPIQLADYPSVVVEVEFATPTDNELELVASNYDDAVIFQHGERI